MMTVTDKLEVQRQAESFGRQSTLAAIGLAAIAAIVLIHAQPKAPVAGGFIGAGCTDCGTVVAVRRSAHSAPVFFVEVRMPDGSLRTVQQLAAGFSVGDVVQVNGNALTLRPT